MRKRGRRNLLPTVTALESRRLLAATIQSVSQENIDLVGVYAESKTPEPTQNDYQDIHIHLNGLRTDLGAVTGVTVFQNGAADRWAYPPAAFIKPALLLNNGSDIYIESRDQIPNPSITGIHLIYQNDPIGDDVALPLQGFPFSYNVQARIAGRGLTATWIGQDGQDWTGPGPSSGTDGIQDVGIHLEHLSNALSGTFDIQIAAVNPDGSTLHWTRKPSIDGAATAQLVGLAANTTTNLDSCDIYISPVTQELVNGQYVTRTLAVGASLSVQVAYSYRTADDPNRINKTDTTSLTAGSFNASLAAPAVTTADLASFTATWQGQLPNGPNESMPGYAQIGLDAASLTSIGQSFTSVTNVILSDEDGIEWRKVKPLSGSDAGYYDVLLQYDSSTGIVSFPPQKNEAGKRMTLRLQFGSGSSAIATVIGQSTDPNLRGTAYDDQAEIAVHNVAELIAYTTPGANQKTNLALDAGVTFTLTEPLDLNYAIHIKGSPTSVIQFAPPPSVDWTDVDWTDGKDMLNINASHVSLTGFTIEAVSRPNVWATPSQMEPSVIFVAKNVRDTRITNMTIRGDISLTPGSSDHQEARILIADADTGGLIAQNTFEGGTIKLRSGPWIVTDNDVQGPFAGMYAFTAFSLGESHDDQFVNNHVHAANGEGSSTTVLYRFVTLGGFTGTGANDLFQDNTFDGGAGQKDAGTNNPEVIVLESYAAFFEGKPRSVSASRKIVSLSDSTGSGVLNRSGTPIQAGYVLTILNGPNAGTWFRIAQVLDDHTLVMLDPVPANLTSHRISVNRGFVNEQIIHNTIDLSSLPYAQDVGIVLGGGSWGTVISQNRFLGQRGIDVHVSGTTAGKDSVDG